MYCNSQIDPIMKVKRSVTLNLTDFAGLLPKIGLAISEDAK